SMEATDIRQFEGKRLPARPDIVVIDVSFISLKAVLPVALSLAAAPMQLLALIKPQYEAERKYSKHGIIRNAMVHQEICDDVTAFCEYCATCGGCAIQHWQIDAYRAWKRKIVVDTLAHTGIQCEVGELVDAHGAGRRRVTIHARRGSDGELRVGFAAAGSHAIVAIEHCPILDPGLSGALGAARALADVLKPSNKPLDIQITATHSGLDVDVRGS